MQSIALSTIPGARAFARAGSLAAWALLALLLVTLSAFTAHRMALEAAQQDLMQEVEHRLELIATGLDGRLARFDFLPSLLEMTPAVLHLLEAPSSPALRDQVNRYLSGINAAAGAEMLYVLDASGVALAAADWNLPDTTVGNDFSFRPYLQEALEKGRGRFYGVGITSKRPGYYLSYALSSDRQTRGVATVKVSLVEAERAWGKLPGTAMLLDERGVVILSTHDAWKFKPLAPLSADALADIARTRPYGDAVLTPVDWVTIEQVASHREIAWVEGVEKLASSRSVNADRWRLVVLDDMAPLRAAARNIAIIAALVGCVAVLLLLVAYQRRRGRQALRAGQVALQAAHDSLESRVVERTAELREAQAALIHAEKMAALGQMSAGLAHELNQPLAAMRALADNACVLLDSRRHDEARGNLQRIGRLVDRLGKLTRQLKLFSRKPSGAATPVTVRAVIASALSLHAERLRAAGIRVEVRVEPPTLRVLADEAQLEQVFINLTGNAIDAVADAPVRCLRIDATECNGRCIVNLHDSGSGIREDILPRLFEPFVTSKAAGAGLGLGLLVSASIVRDFGGRLSGANPAGGGACFSVELELAEPVEHAIHA